MIEYKNLKLDEDLKTCFVDNTEVRLNKSEYKILQYLLNNQNKVFSRKELSENALEKPLSLRVIDTTISRIRKKIGLVGHHIITRQGFGYGFVC